MTIQPLARQIYLKLQQDKIGKFDTSSRESAVEYAEVLAVGIMPECTATTRDAWGIGSFPIKVGDKVFVKAWALDSVMYEGKRYYFINIDSGGILAKVND